MHLKLENFLIFPHIFALDNYLNAVISALIAFDKPW